MSETTTLSHETFEAYEGATFEVADAAGLELELATVTRANAPDGWERFTLEFDGPDDGVLDPACYRLEHGDLGAFDVTLSPTQFLTADGASLYYEAVFSRRATDADGTARAEAREAERTGGPVGMSVDPFLGSVSMFAGNFAPRGFMFCAGQRVSIEQNQALYSLLGTTYGGNGTTYYNLPDLRGRTPIGAGGGPGLTSREPGDEGGEERVTLGTHQMPEHTHEASASLPVSRSLADSRAPAGNHLAQQPTGDQGVDIYAEDGHGGQMAVDSQTYPAGGSRPHDNMPPFLAMNYVIAVYGTYPAHK
ncbi:phage tail protein [Natronobiforma cellulositropha]|uniref:phage tail protein n=1 Tax=Natronobiforma cellulositropha TaxID=1679076 RepID=UPI0021D5EB05|nr:tail fiber protein [Natronobiforma cellulositropha]